MTRPAPEPPALAALREAVQRLRRFGGDQLVRDMTAVFVEDVPSRLAAARAGIAEGDRRRVEHAVHSLKASCGQFGATAMQQRAAAAEQLARDGALDAVPPLLDELAAEFRHVRRWVAREAGARGRE